MENEETFKIISWVTSIIMFAVAVGIVLFLQQIYHSVYARINGKTLEVLSESVENPVSVLDEKESEELPESTEKPVIILSDREMEVLLFTLKGYCAFEVADKLNINKRTVERHKENMINKTDSKKITGVIYYALTNHLFSDEDLKKLQSH